MIRTRQQLSTRLAPFIRAISIDLPAVFGLTLQGSWASGEYHAIEEHGFVCSFSDVDFTYEKSIKNGETRAIEQTLSEAATLCGVRVQSISVRPAEEMLNMWTLSDTENPNERRRIQRDFILFWTLIGAAEACFALSLDDTSRARKYSLNKLFLKIWRDLGIAFGYSLPSYRETLTYAARFLPTAICRTSYALKLGIETGEDWECVSSAHRLSILKETSRLMQNEAEVESIELALRAVMQLEGYDARTWASSAIETAKSYEGDLSTRRAARVRISSKVR